jgi:hypothetical protein
MNKQCAVVDFAVQWQGWGGGSPFASIVDDPDTGAKLMARYRQSRPTRGLVIGLLLCGALVACTKQPEAVPVPATPAPVVAPAEPPATPPAAAVAQAWTPGALDELLAPIALYPDPLIGQILAASTNPQEVMDGGNWLLQNQGLQGDALTSAATKAGFGPAMLALVHFPTVVDMMASQFDWTKQVGEAYKADPAAVLDSIQQLRGEAYRAGNLTTTPEQEVKIVTPAQGGEYVEIQPAQANVVYVPQYDPAQVYTPPAPAPTTTTVVQEGHSTGSLVTTALIAFGAGMLVNELFDDDDDWYRPRWGYGGMYYGGNPWRYNDYHYRPNYGGGWGPHHNYVRPVNYQHGFNNNNIYINQGNNYYGRFNGNQNRLPNRTNSPIAQARPDRRPGDASRPGQLQRPTSPQRPALSSIPDRGKADNWKGRDTYAGRDKAAGQRPGGVERPGTRDMSAARPQAKPAARPQAKPAARPQAKPAARPQAKPAARPQAKPAARPQAKPAARPQAKPAARPQAKPAARPQAKPAARPQAKPAARPQAKPAARPQAKPAARPQAKPAARPQAKPAARPQAKKPPRP